MKIISKNTSTAEVYKYISSTVTPRPIALVSTIDKEGNVNLSPFSFFNAFSADPPILIFSPTRRVRNKTTKHTLENVIEHPECVIHMVNYQMVEQMSLSSTEYDKGINEFIKAGFTEIKSDLVKPPRIKEAPVAFECKVIEVKSLGKKGGAGNLVICEVIAIHIDDKVLDKNDTVDSLKLDLVSRLGGNWYGKTVSNSLFEIPKPLHTTGIGIDQLPESIRNSRILTGNNLARLANIEKLPTPQEIAVLENKNLDWSTKNSTEIHIEAQNFLTLNEPQKALQILLYDAYLKSN